MNKKYLFFALILLVGIISISAVSAADDLASDISVADDDQGIILEESIPQNVLNDENLDVLTNDANEEPALASKNYEPIVSSSSNAKVKENATAKKSSKNKVTFKTISKGSKDKVAVKKIQKALKRNGYYLSYKGHYLKVDGWFGYYTERSVKQFQKAKKLKVTGKVDEKTAEKLRIIDKSNAVIKFKDDKTFVREYNDGRAFEAKIVKKRNGKGIETLLSVDYLKNGKRIASEYYCTDEEGINYITPNDLEVGTYKAKIYCDDGIKTHPKYKTIIIKKTSIRMKAADINVSGKQNIQLKVNLRFKNNVEVDEGKVKFTVDGKSYIVKVQNGLAIKNLKIKSLKSKKYQVTFLGNKNIKAKTVTGKIAKKR